jgi:hypothetical protein
MIAGVAIYGAGAVWYYVNHSQATSNGDGPKEISPTSPPRNGSTARIKGGKGAGLFNALN